MAFALYLMQFNHFLILSAHENVIIFMDKTACVLELDVSESKGKYRSIPLYKMKYSYHEMCFVS